MTLETLQTIILIAFFIVMGSASVAILLKFSQPINVVSLTPAPQPVKQATEGEIKDFMLVAERYAVNHNYNNESFNCLNYTNDLLDICDKLGFACQRVTGCTEDNTSCHAWVRVSVDFEPQTARFTDYSLKYPNQR
jgi:hypothetical protein